MTETLKDIALRVAEDYFDEHADLELVAKYVAKCVEELGKQEPVCWCADYELLNDYKLTTPRQERDTDVPLYAAPVVPAGMVLVPEEPTDGMIEARLFDTPHRARQNYKAMIAVAKGEQP